MSTRLRYFALLVGLLSLAALERATAGGAQASREPRRLALVIGNAAYLRPLEVLPNPVNDARAIGNVLTELGFNVSIVENGTKGGLLSAIEMLKKTLRPEDSVLLYYAGHGVELDGHNYLLPVDLELPEEPKVPQDLENATKVIERDGIEMGPLIESLGEVARVSIAVLDACRDNPFLPTRSSGFTRIGRGLAEMQAKGVLIAYAAGAGQTALDGLPGEANGLYTRELLRAFGVAGLDANALFMQAQRAVSRATAGQQIPFIYDLLTDQFIFREVPFVSSRINPAPASPPGSGLTMTTSVVPAWLVGTYFNENWLNTTTRFKLEWELGISANGTVAFVGKATPTMRGAGNPSTQVNDCRLDLGQNTPMMVCRRTRSTTSRTSEIVETSYALSPSGKNLALSPVGQRGGGTIFYRLDAGR